MQIQDEGKMSEVTVQVFRFHQRVCKICGVSIYNGNKSKLCQKCYGRKLGKKYGVRKGTHLKKL